MTADAMVTVAFRHEKYTFADAELMRYGSPHYDRKRAGQALVKCVANGVKPVHDHIETFERSQIICANEAYPEAAVADPLADLEVWDEWRSGVRAFPYPGRYSRLGIRRQEVKTSSTASVGVLGEILAGVFGQAAIAPWIVVRVVRRWPDFIFHIESDRFAFLESKAYTGDDSWRSSLGVPERLFGDCLVEAVQQLNADSSVEVWKAFTCIERVTPMRVRVLFLQLVASDDKRKASLTRVLPPPVVNGLAERALERAVARLPAEVVAILEQPPKARRHAQLGLERRVVPQMEKELELLLVEEKLNTAMFASREQLKEEGMRLLKRATLPRVREGRRFFEARERAAGGRLSRIRAVGPQALFVADLSAEERAAVTSEWSSNWQSAGRPWRHIAAVPLWRCGGAVFAVGPDSLEGASIDV